MLQTLRPVVPVWLLALAIALGCAGASVKTTQRVADESFPEPGVLLVYDFATGPEDVVEDTLGHEFGIGEESLSKEQQIAHATSRSLSEQLVAQLQKRGINAQRVTDNYSPPLHAMVIKGQFITIDKGSRVARMVIGFGAGTSELRARVQAYQMTEYGLRRIATAETAAHGSRMPGMAVPVAGGAALGTAATSAVISGGMNIVKEVRGGMDADAGRMAEEIAKRAEDFYKRQGWL